MTAVLLLLLVAQIVMLQTMLAWMSGVVLAVMLLDATMPDVTPCVVLRVLLGWIRVTGLG